MSESTAPRNANEVIENAKGTSDGEEPAHLFPEEDRTEGATEQEKADAREGTTQRGGEHETLGPGSPGASVEPDKLR